MGTRVRLWRWAYRWFRPQQKEEFGVEITPAGELAGFEHEIPEEAARPAASAEQARALAEDFLRTPPASRSRRRSNSSRNRTRRGPHRVDREFTWKERDFNLRDATNRMAVTVLGDEVGGYREYLKIPGTVDARLPAPALQERGGADRRFRAAGGADAGPGGGDRHARAPPGRALAARGGGGAGGHGALAVRQPEPVSS